MKAMTWRISSARIVLSILLVALLSTWACKPASVSSKVTAGETTYICVYLGPTNWTTEGQYVRIATKVNADKMTRIRVPNSWTSKYYFNDSMMAGLGITDQLTPGVGLGVSVASMGVLSYQRIYRQVAYRDYTAAPSPVPTISPSHIPTMEPTQAPSQVPSVQPSEAPSEYPTEVPTENPSASPSIAPSPAPSASPSTDGPTVAPSDLPSLAPSASPSVVPTQSPSVSPSVIPTQTPSVSPSTGPSQGPTASPSDLPSLAPTVTPSFLPTPSPSRDPTETPTVSPTETPSEAPDGSGRRRKLLGIEEQALLQEAFLTLLDSNSEQAIIPNDITYSITYPMLSVIIVVDNGNIQSVTWDNFCGWCSPGSCLPNTISFDDEEENPVGGNCFVEDDSCQVYLNDGTTTTTELCELSVYVTWMGTDSKGATLQSGAARFSRWSATQMTDFTSSLQDADVE